ncbi:hypothetical protein [Desulfamplus magnetovallimortis]|nr:hypothetical protein [Desulfamplus magnetovallimortis]
MAGVLDHAETVVIGNNSSEFKDIVSQVGDGQVVVDLVRGVNGMKSGEGYDGICW